MTSCGPLVVCIVTELKPPPRGGQVSGHRPSLLSGLRYLQNTSHPQTAHCRPASPGLSEPLVRPSWVYPVKPCLPGLPSGVADCGRAARARRPRWLVAHPRRPSALFPRLALGTCGRERCCAGFCEDACSRFAWVQTPDCDCSVTLPPSPRQLRRLTSPPAGRRRPFLHRLAGASRFPFAT